MATIKVEETFLRKVLETYSSSQSSLDSFSNGNQDINIFSHLKCAFISTTVQALRQDAYLKQQQNSSHFASSKVFKLRSFESEI